MKITKYEHACLTIEIDNRVLVIDPGIYSNSFAPSNNIDAVVITHEHSDHFDPEKIAAILSLNPDVVIFATDKVAEQISYAKVPGTNEEITIGSFKLQFFGHDHASIVDDVVPCDNFGVVVNKILAYAGDSFALPSVQPQILAAPASAPWLKVNEVLQYITAVKPAKVFPAHNALLTEIGQDITYAWLRRACDQVGAEFIDLQSSQELTI
jgi:L-ascorbate metabolism protein UlaG (beta-lactamase superfamily)